MAAIPDFPDVAAHADRAPDRVASRPQGVRRAGRADDDRSDDSLGRRRSRREDQSGAAGARGGRRRRVHGVPFAAGAGALARVLGIGTGDQAAQRIDLRDAHICCGIASPRAREESGASQVRQGAARRCGRPWPSRSRAPRRELGVRREGHRSRRSTTRAFRSSRCRTRPICRRGASTSCRPPASGRSISTASRSSRTIPI